MSKHCGDPERVACKWLRKIEGMVIKQSIIDKLWWYEKERDEEIDIYKSSARKAGKGIVYFDYFIPSNKK